MSMIIEGGTLSPEEQAQWARKQYLRKKSQAKYHKRWVLFQRLDDRTWQFFTTVYDLKYQDVLTSINGNTGKETKEIKEEIHFETISGEERTIRKLREMPKQGESNETSCDQQSSNSGGNTMTGP